MIKNLNVRKKFWRTSTWLTATVTAGGIGIAIWKYNDNKDKIIINAKNPTTLYQLSKKLDYDYEELKDLNDDIDSYIREGQEIVIKLSDLKKSDYADYEIKKGDTLSEISDKFGIDTGSLEKFDEKLESDEELQKHVGEKVSIYKRNGPKIRTIKYTVKKGDTLLGIVDKINSKLEKKISLESVLEGNKLKSNSIIYPDQKLIITVEATKKEVKQIKKDDNKVKKTKSSDTISGKDKIERKYGKLRGIDISSNNKIDWDELAKSKEVDFIIIKMFDGYNMDYNEKSKDGTDGCLNKLDSKFFENVKMCEKYNIPFGIYIYTRATNEKMAELESKKALHILSKADIRPTYPIYYDVESQAAEPLKDETGKSVSSVDFIRNNPDQVIANFRAFAKVLEDNNYYCGLYTNHSAINNIDPKGDKLSQYTIWYSRYTGLENSFSDYIVMKDGYKGNIGMYQFTSQGKVKGVSGYVDCNYCKTNYSKVIIDLDMNNPIKEGKSNQR